jgi:predicted RND superfamily exporter protein
MGWLGVPLGSISVAFPAVALVACAANCIHYLWALRRRGAGGTLQCDAAAPLAAMCCIPLAGGAALAVLLLAEFLPNRQLGLCAVTGLAIAAFGGSLLLPRLLLPWLPTAALGAAAAGGFDHGDGLKRA